MPPAKSASACMPFSTRPSLSVGSCEHVDGFVERRVGVDVRAEPRAGRFQRRNQLAGLEALRAVEGHVLEEVRQPLLIVLLVYRARLHRQLKADALFRPRVAPDVVFQPVRQRAGRDRRIERDRLGQGRSRGRGLCRRRRALRAHRRRGHQANDEQRDEQPAEQAQFHGLNVYRSGVRGSRFAGSRVRGFAGSAAP